MTRKSLLSLHHYHIASNNSVFLCQNKDCRALNFRLVSLESAGVLLDRISESKYHEGYECGYSDGFSDGQEDASS